jgi:hypothetical protein
LKGVDLDQARKIAKDKKKLQEYLAKVRLHSTLIKARANKQKTNVIGW